MDGHLVDKANHGVAASDDGRISRKDAEAIIFAVRYGFGYNDVEEDALNDIRDNYKWSEGTDVWFGKSNQNLGRFRKLPMGASDCPVGHLLYKSCQKSNLSPQTHPVRAHCSEI